MALITQYGQKCLIFIEVPQLRIADGSGFVKKNESKDNNKDSIKNNDNVTEDLNSHFDNTICLLV